MEAMAHGGYVSHYMRTSPLWDVARRGKTPLCRLASLLREWSLTALIPLACWVIRYMRTSTCGTAPKALHARGPDAFESRLPDDWDGEAVRAFVCYPKAEGADRRKRDD